MKIRLEFTILFCIFAVYLTAQPARSDSIVRVGACATPGITWGVFVQDSFAYVADRSAFTIVNIFDPAVPWIVSSTSDPWTEAISLFVQDTLAYLDASALFTVMSVLDPGFPNRIGWCFLPIWGGLDPKGIWVTDTLCYIARANKGFVTVNVAHTDSPEVIDTFDTPGHAVDIFIQDTLLYIADYDSLQIVNVSIPSNPVRIGACRMPNGCLDVFVSGSYAYVACQSSFGNDGSLQVVDISNPSLPNIVESVNTINGDPFAVYIINNYAYIVAADYWFASKGKKRIVGGLRDKTQTNYRADVEGGLRIVDIFDPLNPNLVCSYDTPGDPRDVFTVDSLVYVADYDSLQILKHITTGVEEEITTCSEASYAFKLIQNSPNPFSRSTTISCELPLAKSITLKVYDSTGRAVKTLFDGYQESGSYNVIWNSKDSFGREVDNGVYFCQLKSGSVSLVRKLIVVR